MSWWQRIRSRPIGRFAVWKFNWLANHKIVAVGTTVSQTDMKICIAMLSASSNQIGDAYRQ